MLITYLKVIAMFSPLFLSEEEEENEKALTLYFNFCFCKVSIMLAGITTMWSSNLKQVAFSLSKNGEQIRRGRAT